VEADARAWLKSLVMNNDPLSMSERKVRVSRKEMYSQSLSWFRVFVFMYCRRRQFKV